MKLLLDENLPKRLKLDFPDFDVRTVRELGWNGQQDSALLALAMAEGFTALLTFDKNMRYQQNFTKSPVTVFLLIAPNNTYAELTKLSPLIRNVLHNQTLLAGPMAIYESMGA